MFCEWLAFSHRKNGLSMTISARPQILVDAFDGVSPLFLRSMGVLRMSLQGLFQFLEDQKGEPKDPGDVGWVTSYPMNTVL